MQARVRSVVCAMCVVEYHKKNPIHTTFYCCCLCDRVRLSNIYIYMLYACVLRIYVCLCMLCRIASCVKGMNETVFTGGNFYKNNNNNKNAL